MNIQNDLFELQDFKYKDFSAKLIPTVDPERIIGIRTPVMRKYSKELFKSGEYESFLKILPHRYYEENNLHAFIIEQLNDFDRVIYETERFLPYIDNWATCDSFLPKVFRKNTDKLLPKIKEWIKSDKTYTVRYAIGLLMGLYLDDKFNCEYPEMVAQKITDEYYINMMIAWYFATALSKQYDSIIPYLTQNRLESWVHNKTIQKAIESRRISDEEKNYLKTLKIKKQKI